MQLHTRQDEDTLAGCGELSRPRCDTKRLARTGRAANSAPLVFVVLWMGIYPSSFIDPIEVSVASLLADYNTALAAAAAAAAATSSTV